MKQKLLNSLRLRVCMLVAMMAFAISGAWAEEVTFTPGTDTGETSVTKNNVTATMSTMNNISYYQIYANSSGTFTCTNGKITKIEFTCTASGTSKYGPGNASSNVGSYSYSGTTGTWTGNAESVTISSTSQIRMSSLVITYSPSASEPFTVTLGDDNTPLTEASAGAGVTLPARSNVSGYTFAGWSTTNVTTETTTAPTIIQTGTYHPTANVTLYPIYTRTETASQTASVTISDYATTNNWGSSTSSGQKNITIDTNVKATCNSGSNSGKYYSDGWRIYQSESGKITISTTAGVLSSVKFTFTNNNNGTLNYNNSVLASGTAVAVSGTSKEFSLGNSGSATNGQIRITAIEVTYNVSTSYYISSVVTLADNAITGLQNSYTIDLANNEMDLDLSSATATSGATVQYEVTSSTISSDDYELENGTLTVSANGVMTIRAYVEADATYAAAEKEVTVTAIDNPTIAYDGTTATTAYGTAYVIDPSMVEGGDITVNSGNTDVATVLGLTITPDAVGTATITINTAESDIWHAGTATFTLNVTPPAGKTTAYITSSTLFEETFAECKGTGGTGGFSGTGNDAIISDNSGWTFTKANAANGCGKFGSSSASGSAVTPSINVTSGLVYTLTFKAAPWNTEDNTSMNITVEGGSISGVSTTAMTPGEWNQYSATITATSSSIKITFGASQNRFFLDDVKVEYIAQPLTATLNSSGYATYCSEYPLSFADATDYSAWQITDIKGTTITFSQVTGSVKGGTGLLLKGENGKTGAITLTSVASTTVLDGNLLEGTLAPTYVEANEYYGLSGNQFVKVNAGTVKAGKALLPASALHNNVKAFTFVFDGADGIRTVETVSAEEAQAIFNLAGQRLPKAQRGVNIINGKKVVVK